MTKVLHRGGGLVSQGLNSFGNLAYAVAIAQVTVPRQFGAWAIAYAVFAGAQAISRAVAGTPLLIRGADTDPKAVYSMSCYLAVGVGLSAGIVLAVLGVAAPTFRDVALSLACFIPGALLQDALRYEFMARHRAHLAAVGDALWFVVLAGVTIALFALGLADVVSVTVAWGGSALISCSALLLLAENRPSYTAFRAELGRNRSNLARLAAEASLIHARTYLIPVVVGAVAGLAAAGALRAGYTLLGVTGVVVLGLTPLATVEAVRNRERGGSDWAFLFKWSACVFAVAFVLGTLLLVMPDSWGTRLLAANWEDARHVLLPLVIHSLLRGPLTGVPILLRAHGRFSHALKLRLWAEGPAIAVPVIGAFYWGAAGAAWGLVVNAVQMNAQSLLRLARAKRAERETSTTDGETDARSLLGARRDL